MITYLDVKPSQLTMLNPSRYLFLLLWLSMPLLPGCSPTTLQRGDAVRPPAITSDAFITADNAVLPLRTWPAKPNPVNAVLVVLHGFNDYSNAFTNLGEYLSAHQHITTYAYDQRGFGQAGEPGTWAGTESYVQDLREICALVRARHPGAPVYVMGESMGGAIAMVAFTSDNPPDADGVILSAPAVWSRDTMPWYQRAALFVGAHLFPWAAFTGEGIEITASDNNDMLRALGRDPLVIKATKVGAMYGLTNLMDEAMASSPRYEKPSLVLIGNKDEIVPNHASAVMLKDLQLAAKPEEKVVIYDNGYHMLTRDLQGQVVINDIASWITHQNADLPSGEDKKNVQNWIEENLP